MLGILSRPAPLRIDRPQWHVREHDDGRAAGERRYVLLQPPDLLVAQRAHALTLVLEHVHEPEEVGALVVEALPATALDGPFAVASEVLLAAVEKHVMLAGHIEDALGLHALEDFRDGVEGPGLLTVRLIARVQDEGGRRPQRVDAVDDLLQRRRSILVGFALEADVSVADLDEVEAARSGG